MLTSSDVPREMEHYIVEDVMEGDGDEMTTTHYLEEVEVQDTDEYGGMDLHMYDSIVIFKKIGRFPPHVEQGTERAGFAHWKTKCTKFILSSDNETLLYYNPNGPLGDHPKIVVKRGETRRVVERIHDMIGHLGMKRTQFTIIRKLYWRSIKNDVRNYINSCDFCLQKKLEGRKIFKAPIDLLSEDFDLIVSVRSQEDVMTNGGDRLLFSLKGIDEEAVRMAAVQRMTPYTFKETVNDQEQSLKIFPSVGFKRQPYVKKSRFAQNATGFLIPLNNKEEYIEVFPDDQYEEHIVVEEGVEGEGQMITVGGQVYHQKTANTVHATAIRDDTDWSRYPCTSTLPVKDGNTMNKDQEAAYMEDRQKGDHSDQADDQQMSIKKHRKSLAIRKPQMKFSQNVSGAGQRFSSILNAPDKLLNDAGELVNSFEEAQRADLCPLAPIMFMPSTDPDVVMLQKELLQRQRKIQLMQEQVLQTQIDGIMRMEGAQEVHTVTVDRYDELVGGDRECVQEEELNVMDADQRQDKQIMY